MRVGPGERARIAGSPAGPGSLSSSACRRCVVGPQAVPVDEIFGLRGVIGGGAIRDIRAIVRETIDFDQTFCQPLVAQALDLGHPQPHPSRRQSAGRPLRQAPKGGWRGKSGLHGRTVPDNVRRGPVPAQAGGNLRESATESRPPLRISAQREQAARVKGCGKSAPRRRQRRRHGKPHREQDRIGTARSESFRDRCLDLAVRVGCIRRRATGVAEEWPSRTCGVRAQDALCCVPYKTRLTGRLISEGGSVGTPPGPHQFCRVTDRSSSDPGVACWHRADRWNCSTRKQIEGAHNTCRDQPIARQITSPASSRAS